MALHPLRLPKSAALLFRIVALHKRLLRALADPSLVTHTVNTSWVQAVWANLDAGWVRKFCLGGQLTRIQDIAAATPAARQVLYEEFCRQNKVPAMLGTGGAFRDLLALHDFNSALAETVTALFRDSYDLLGQASRTKGYVSRGGRVITKAEYRRQFREANPAKVVCPYCDGDIGTPELDHYYSKSQLPLLACSPWNLVPVCKSCNDATVAKGDRLALTPGPNRSAKDWLHPIEQPASEQVRIRLTGNPRQAVPQLWSPDKDEQRRLDNHHWLLDRLDQPRPSRYLSDRWTNAAAAFFDVLVLRVNRKRQARSSIDHLVQDQLFDLQESRGRLSNSLVHAAVCQAVLDRRPEYLEEFSASNPPALA